MSKINVGVGEPFPLEDEPKAEDRWDHCAQHWRARHWRRRHRGVRAAGLLIALPAATASVTAAILYPLTTLGLIAALGAGAAAARYGGGHHDRDGHWRCAHRNGNNGNGERPDDKPRDTQPSAPVEPQQGSV